MTRPDLPRTSSVVGLVALGAAAVLVVQLLGAPRPGTSPGAADPGAVDAVSAAVVAQALADPALADTPLPATPPPYLEHVTGLATVGDDGTMATFQSTPMSVVVCDVPADGAEVCTDGMTTIREEVADGRRTLVQIPAWAARLGHDADDPAQVARDWVRAYWELVPLDRGAPPTWLRELTAGTGATASR